MVAPHPNHDMQKHNKHKSHSQKAI